MDDIGKGSTRVRLACLALAFTIAATPASSREREVAITFDDVPMVASPVSACDVDGLRSFTGSFTKMLQGEQIPTTILVNLGTICEEKRVLWPELLRKWAAAGAEVGDHSFSHTDLNQVSADAFLRDALRDDDVIRSVAREFHQQRLWFRFPQLHSGETIEKKENVARGLAAAGYANAPVTIDSDEWLFASAYLKAHRANDACLKAKIGRAYLSYMQEAFGYSERLSRQLFGREIRQVVLLHASLLNLDYFHALAAEIKRRGYRAISLERAVSDPAYSSTDAYAGKKGISWLQRWAVSRQAKFASQPEAPQWIRDLATA